MTKIFFSRTGGKTKDLEIILQLIKTKRNKTKTKPSPQKLPFSKRSEAPGSLGEEGLDQMVSSIVVQKLGLNLDTATSWLVAFGKAT